MADRKNMYMGNGIQWIIWMFSSASVKNYIATNKCGHVGCSCPWLPIRN